MTHRGKVAISDTDRRRGHTTNIASARRMPFEQTARRHSVLLRTFLAVLYHFELSEHFMGRADSCGSRPTITRNRHLLSQADFCASSVSSEILAHKSKPIKLKRLSIFWHDFSNNMRQVKSGPVPATTLSTALFIADCENR